MNTMKTKLNKLIKFKSSWKMMFIFCDNNFEKAEKNVQIRKMKLNN